MRGSRPTVCSASGGFTLIEFVAVLILVGILGAFAAVGLNQSARAYLIATENADVAQKAQLAMVRIGLELTDCRQGCAGASPQVVIGGGVGEPRFLNFRNSEGDRRIVFDPDAGQILIGPDGVNQQRILVDQVADFRVSRIENPIDPATDLFDVDLTLDHRQAGITIDFGTRVYYER